MKVKEKFNTPYNSKEVEEKIYQLWEKSGFFDPDKLPVSKNYKLKAKSYCIVIPPPNVTGSLHMGHALNAVIQDILIRQKRMQGYKTLWLPGTDHAGIATQNVVEKELKKQGLTRHDLGREKFIEKVWEWKEKYGNIILEQLKKLGSSCDWSRTRFTMDKDYAKAVETAFLYYYKKGWIYQGDRVVNWCKRCQTSLSDLELEYEDEKGKLWYIRYPIKTKNFPPKAGQPFTEKLKTKNYITVATTRPETILGDSAVAVNPKDKRYKNLVGKTVVLPIMNREIPVVSDSAVEIEFGTGAVKITPAHDILDFEISERHKLSIYKVINQFGKMSKEAGKDYEGLSTKDARVKVVEELEKENLIEKIEDYDHRISKCYRCNSIIEPQISKQWFLKMSELAKIAKQAVKKGDVKFHPKRWEKIYFDWLDNIRDWCISRQIWWGHQLPVYFCQNKQEAISNSQFLISKQIQNSKLKIKNSSDSHFIITTESPKHCPFCKQCHMKQAEDVLDTWFSSALWPFATLGWPDSAKATAGKLNKDDLKEFYPTQVLSTARDIINLWVTRMIFSSAELLGKKPFNDVIIHPTILTKDGKRMSKSLGTGIDPMVLIEKYGADATRFGLIYQMMGGQDIHFNEDGIMAGKKFANKIWNASRFVLLQIGNTKLQIQSPKSKTSADKKIISQLIKIKKSVDKDLGNYQFGQALHEIYDFFWHQFCDVYLEKSKEELNAEILIYVLSESLKLLHPFMPFITEEIYQHLAIKNKKMLIVEKW